MDEKDRRVLRTHKILAEALSALSLEKGYSNVTIRDITERANVAYSTFFRHYRDKDELLLKILESIIETLSELVVQGADTSPETVGRLVFTHVQENSTFYHVLFSDQSSYRIVQKVQTSIEQIFVKGYAQYSPGPIPVNITANHVVSSIFALIKWWLDHDMPYPVEQMAFVYSELIIKPVEKVVFLAPHAEGS